MAFGDSDLPAFFADMGESVVINGQTIKAFVDTPESPWEHGSLGSMVEGCVKVTAAGTAFTALPTAGMAATVRGASYTVKSRNLVGDGRIIEIELKVA